MSKKRTFPWDSDLLMVGFPCLNLLVQEGISEPQKNPQEKHVVWDNKQNLGLQGNSRNSTIYLSRYSSPVIKDVSYGKSHKSRCLMGKPTKKGQFQELS